LADNPLAEDRHAPRRYMLLEISDNRAGLAMPCETAHPAVISPDIAGLVVGKKLEACGGSVGDDDTFT
jgi:hypothetical protein